MAWCTSVYSIENKGTITFLLYHLETKKKCHTICITIATTEGGEGVYHKWVDLQCLKTGDKRACVYLCVCMCVYVCMYVYVYIYLYVCMCMKVCMYVCVFTCMYVRVYACVCMCACMHVCEYVCVYVCVKALAIPSSIDLVYTLAT